MSQHLDFASLVRYHRALKDDPREPELYIYISVLYICYIYIKISFLSLTCPTLILICSVTVSFSADSLHILFSPSLRFCLTRELTSKVGGYYVSALIAISIPAMDERVMYTYACVLCMCVCVSAL